MLNIAYTHASVVLIIFHYYMLQISKMTDDKALTSLPNDQNFTLHCSAMKAIKSLNDQDVLVCYGTRLKWN